MSMTIGWVPGVLLGNHLTDLRYISVQLQISHREGPYFWHLPYLLPSKGYIQVLLVSSMFGSKSGVWLIVKGKDLDHWEDCKWRRGALKDSVCLPPFVCPSEENRYREEHELASHYVLNTSRIFTLRIYAHAILAPEMLFSVAFHSQHSHQDRVCGCLTPFSTLELITDHFQKIVRL